MIYSVKPNDSQCALLGNYVLYCVSQHDTGAEIVMSAYTRRNNVQPGKIWQMRPAPN